MRPSPALLEAAARLGWVADFLVVTSNFLHLFEPQLAKAAGVPLLSMVELVLAEVEHRGWRCVGALGFGDPVVYTERLRQRGLGVSTARRERVGTSTARSTPYSRAAPTTRRRA